MRTNVHFEMSQATMDYIVDGLAKYERKPWEPGQVDILWGVRVQANESLPMFAWLMVDNDTDEIVSMGWPK